LLYKIYYYNIYPKNNNNNIIFKMPTHDDTIDRYSFRLVERLIDNVTFEYVFIIKKNNFFF
jgi:hypothetical protein